MSPQHNTDHQSASSTGRRRRADALRNREAVIDAAGRLFASAASPADVTMDDIARAAGVGKGTLFRGFGDRAGLVQAVYDARLAPLRRAVTERRPPFDEETEPSERVVALLDAILVAKIENRHLALALEQEPTGGVWAPAYAAAHSVLVGLLSEQAERDGREANPDATTWTAHALLGVVRADLVSRMIADGSTAEVLRRRTRELALLLTAPTPTSPGSSR